MMDSLGLKDDCPCHYIMETLPSLISIKRNFTKVRGNQTRVKSRVHIMKSRLNVCLISSHSCQVAFDPLYQSNFWRYQKEPWILIVHTTHTNTSFLTILHYCHWIYKSATWSIAQLYYVLKWISSELLRPVNPVCTLGILLISFHRYLNFTKCKLL